MTTFILIHGAWHGSWCWERVTPILRARGYHVIAPDLPGMGRDQTPLSAVTLETWTHYVRDLILQQNEKVILVGHSRGGIIISQVAEYISKNISGLIYLSAFLIPDGETLWGALHQHPRESERQSDLTFSADMSTSTIIKTAVRDTFYNTTSDSWIKRAQLQLGPEPMVSFTTPLSLSEENFGQVPRAYIECLQDRAIPIELQRKMVSRLPCNRIITMDTDHSPFYSAPKRLATKLISLATALNK